jgi:hypothetical protein
MTILQIIIALLFLISIGSMNIHRTKNSNAMIENSITGKLLLTVLPLLSIAFLTITISNIAHLKWYWSIIISIISVFLLSGLLANIYSSILGIKSKPMLSIEAGGYVRQNLHIIDSLITFCLGIVLFLII